MVIHSVNKKAPNSKRLEEILNLKTSDESLLREAIKILHDNGSIDYASEKAASLMKSAWSDVEKIITPSKAKEHLESLNSYLINRSL